MAYLSVSFTSKQNLSEKKLNSQKSIWFYFLEKKFLSTIICVPNFVAPNYQKVITDLYSFLFRFILVCPFSEVWTPAL